MELSKAFTLNHQDIRMQFVPENDPFGLCGFMPAAANGDYTKREARPLVNLAVSGKPSGTLQMTSHAGYFMQKELRAAGFTRRGNITRVSYKSPVEDLHITVQMESVPGTSVIRFQTFAQNCGGQPVDISFLSSVFLQGICLDGLRSVFDPQKIRLHYCRQTWHGEGQWQTSTLAEMGLYNSSSIWCGSSASIHSLGSFSTSRYAPVMIVEDTETSCFWYIQAESCANWNIEVGFSGSYQNGSLYLMADAANENVGGWHKTLAPGETFETDTAAAGCLKGSFSDVLEQLTKYRRTLLPKGVRQLPLIFNDYMNCIWGAPTDQLILPLIDRAAQIGADIFCIDAGWFTRPGRHWEGGFGDWEPGDQRFGEYTLQQILDYIRGKGMEPGLWLEIEVCSDTARLYQKPDDWFLMRNGKRVEGGMRCFLNFTNAQVREYVRSVFDRLIGMGVTFFKNDYNLSAGIGADNLSDSAADGLLQNMNAFYGLLDEIRQSHPGVLLEGCASGGMRGDYKTLSHFDFSSSSDQIQYTRYPSVITGSLRNILPEQLGIWCYPWPAPFENVDCTGQLTSEEYARQMEDTEQTVYNVVNGMCGVMYLSGRIDCMDQKNLDVLKEGAALYKAYRPFLHQSCPVMAAPHCHVSDPHSWHANALINEAHDRLLLAVWRNDHHDDIFDVDLSALRDGEPAIEQIFPKAIRDAAWYYDEVRRILSVRLPKKHTARLLEIKVKPGI